MRAGGWALTLWLQVKGCEVLVIVCIQMLAIQRSEYLVVACSLLSADSYTVIDTHILITFWPAAKPLQ